LSIFIFSFDYDPVTSLEGTGRAERGSVEHSIAGIRQKPEPAGTILEGSPRPLWLVTVFGQMTKDG
jgi:hypothetical protein